MNSINIKNRIICVINTIVGLLPCRVFSQELRLEALPPLPKAIGSSYQVRPNTLSKGANNIGSCYLARLKTLQNRVGCGCPARPTSVRVGSWTQYPWVWLCSHTQGYFYLYYKYFKFYYYKY